jgi:pyrimidine-nucleoside phosphorylase
MRMVDIIQKKRDGGKLSKQEIDFMIDGYTHDTIPDYQMSAFAMAVFYQGMTDEELSSLTMAMVNSGETIDLSPIKGVKVDKHSTGGVGDKISFIVAPLVATAGVPVAKMSGRGLGHTGGTIDKLESIPGFKVELSRDEFIDNVNKHKIAIVGQSGNLTPADKKLYGLRDVTATVDSIPLIASSIMSKKIASGADAIVLDVKTGSGAFMKSLEDARALAKAMVAIGKGLNRETIAVISDMSQPLGYEIGNANEMKEAIRVLRGERIEDLRTVALTIASHMTVLGGIFEDYDKAYEELSRMLDEGSAIATLKEFVSAQGGDSSVIDEPEKLSAASYQIEVTTSDGGYVAAITAEKVGIAAMLLGAGRKTKEDKIDHSVGITLKKKIGDFVEAGEAIAILHSNEKSQVECSEMLASAFAISSEKVNGPTMIHDTIK